MFNLKVIAFIERDYGPTTSKEPAEMKFQFNCFYEMVDFIKVIINANDGTEFKFIIEEG